MNEVAGGLVVDEETGEVVTVTEEMRLQARQTHEDILHHGARSLEQLRNLGRSLETMRDRRLYLALGHRSFEGYCTEVLQVSRDWADRRILVAGVIENNAAALRQIANISQTSLALLAKIPPLEQTEFIETHLVGGLSTREMEEAIRQYKAGPTARNEPVEVVREVKVPTPDPKTAEENKRLRQQLGDLQAKHGSADEAERRAAEAEARRKAEEARATELAAAKNRLAAAADLDATLQQRATELMRAVTKAMQPLRELRMEAEAAEEVGDLERYADYARLRELERICTETAGLIHSIVNPVVIEQRR